MKKEKFLKVYANLPIKIREEIILVLDECGPITWNVAFIEISNETSIGKKIIKKLSDLKII